MLECWKKRFFQVSILSIFPEEGLKGIHSLKGHDEEIVLGRSWTVVCFSVLSIFFMAELFNVDLILFRGPQAL